MARRARCDEPGSWHHVYNRAGSRRPVFLCRADYRYFLACIARVVWLGLLELHAFCLMRNHYHLLVRSVGRLGEALKLIQNRYSRYFNRRLRRDGPLWRTRFQSYPVTTNSYHRLLVSYIDSNPVAAAAAASPREFRYGSAFHYARERRPPWLATEWVEAQVRELTGRCARDPSAYEQRFPVRCSPDFRAWVERRLAGRATADALDDLLDSEPAYVRDWLRRKAMLADGPPDDQPVAAPGALVSALQRQRLEAPDWNLRRNDVLLNGWDVVLSGLLRDACRLSYDDVARTAGCAHATAYARSRAHHEAMANDEHYATRAATLLRAALAEFVGPPTM